MVVEVRRLAAAQPVVFAAEVELAARVAGFRLPVVEVQEVQEVAAAEIVASLDLRDVGRERVGPLVAEDRVPAVAVAERAEARCSNCGIAGVPLIADALIVRAGNAEHVEAEVAGD